MTKNVEDAIFDYLVSTNRPYSVIDIVNNLKRKDCGKAAVVKALASLVLAEKVREKTYNKQKVYAVDQGSLFPATDPTELKAIEQNISTLKQGLQDEKEQLKGAESELKQLNSALETKEAEKLLIQGVSELKTKQAHLEKLKANSGAISVADKEKILKDREKFVKEWRKRKRITNDILDAILETYPKSKKELLDVIGVETDESCGIQMPEL